MNKKIILSALAALSLSSVAYSTTLTLYTDPTTGQVYTTPGEGRIEMGDFVDARTIDLENRAQDSAIAKAKAKYDKKYTNVAAKTDKLKFSGTHYFGLTSVSPERESTTTGTSTGFELRRNYLQVKAYLLENPKSFYRVTLDTTKTLAGSSSYADVYTKYAYLYLDSVLPYTGVEIGIAHRPWIDYEEHNSWHYRSINKVALEQKREEVGNGPDLVNSADLGVNFKTKIENFSSEIGIYNGEGYHADKAAANQENSKDLSLEWRLTGHLIGSGEKVGHYKKDKDTYLNLSTFGLISKNHKDDNVTANDAAEYDRSFYGIHAVYNQPDFLIAAQYFIADDDFTTSGVSDKEYKAWSINGEYRFTPEWSVIGRYDMAEKKKIGINGAADTLELDMRQAIYGVVYEYDKNVKFIANAKYITDDVETAAAGSLKDSREKNVYMMTTEIHW